MYDGGGQSQPVRTVLILLLLAPLTFSQRVVNARAGMIYYAEGAITLDGRNVRAAKDHRPPQIQDGQVVGSPRGHSEILLGPGAVLWTGTGAQVRFDNTSAEDVRLSLLSGSLMIEIKSASATNRLRVETGEHIGEIRQAGIYRFDRDPDCMRVFDGELLLDGSTLKAMRGQEWADGSARTFDRRETDEFFYWAAFRSLALERDAGRMQRWKRKGDSNVAHGGFDVVFPSDLSVARVKSLAAGMNGLLYVIEGNVSTDGTPSVPAARLPLWLGYRNALRTQNGKADVFFGVGVVAYMVENSAIRAIDARNWAPMIAVEQGSAMIEVTKEAPVVRVQVGDTITSLQAPGVYEFDTRTATLSVYRGASESQVQGVAVRARDGQRVNLKASKPAATFNRQQQSALFRWAADSSFRLFITQAPFMTNWESDIAPMQAKHKVFGKRQDRRVRPLPRPWSSGMSKGFSF